MRSSLSVCVYLEERSNSTTVDLHRGRSQLAFRWWSKCISSVISRTASRNVLFSSARIGKALNVDRVPPLNDGPQHGTQFGSSSDDLQAFIDEFDLMISNQDVMQF